MIAHIKVSGRVQGVGFRYIIVQKAIEHSVNGWVRNNDDGTVSIEAEADKAILEKFIKLLPMNLHRFIKIEKIDVKYSHDKMEYKEFKIIY